MGERTAFGGGDQRYLRDVQYGTAEKLDARVRLHRSYSTSSIPFPTFEARLVDWTTVASVLECGCGNGRFWDNGELPRSLRLTLTDLSPGMVAKPRSERAPGASRRSSAGRATCRRSRTPTPRSTS